MLIRLLLSEACFLCKKLDLIICQITSVVSLVYIKLFFEFCFSCAIMIPLELLPFFDIGSNLSASVLPQFHVPCKLKSQLYSFFITFFPLSS